MLKVDSFNWTVPLKNSGDGLHSCPRRNIGQEECSVSGFEGLFCSYIVGLEEELMTMFVLSREFEYQHSETLVLCPCHPSSHRNTLKRNRDDCSTVMLSLQCSFNDVPQRACAVRIAVQTLYKTFPRKIHIDKRRL